MSNVKRIQQEESITQHQEKYVEVYEELNRIRKDDKQVEEALFRVIKKENVRYYSGTNQEAIQKKHSIKKIWNALKSTMVK